MMLDHSHELGGTTFVAAPNRSGARRAIDHVVGLGHRRIGFITGRPGVSSAGERLAGYRDALRDAGIPDRHELVVTGDFPEERGHEATEQSLRLPEPPTAILTSADTAAVGAIKAARAAGLRLPDDISIVGFDDIPEASLVMPQLTTVRRPLMEMGATAVRLLQRLMDEPEASLRKTELETELLVRGSTAPPPRARRH